MPDQIKPWRVTDLPWKRELTTYGNDTIILSNPDGSGENTYVTLDEFKEYALNSGASPAIKRVQLHSFINEREVYGTHDFVVGHPDSRMAGGPFFPNALMGMMRPVDIKEPIITYWNTPVTPEWPYQWEPQFSSAKVISSKACLNGVLVASVDREPYYEKLHWKKCFLIPQTSFNSAYLITYRAKFRAYGFSGKIPPTIWTFKGRVGFVTLSANKRDIVEVTCINELFAQVLTWDEMIVGGTYLLYKLANTAKQWIIPIVWCYAYVWNLPAPGFIQMETHYTRESTEFSIYKMV